MEWAALIAWVLTALGGFAMLAIWLERGGLRRGDEPGPRIRASFLFTHFSLAVAGLVLWIVYLIADREWIAWVAFAALVIVVLLGMGMFKAWLQRRSRPARRTLSSQPAVGGGAATMGAEPPEQGFPAPLVAGHGVAAVVTLVFVIGSI